MCIKMIICLSKTPAASHRRPLFLRQAIWADSAYEAGLCGIQFVEECLAKYYYFLACLGIFCNFRHKIMIFRHMLVVFSIFLHKNPILGRCWAKVGFGWPKRTAQRGFWLPFGGPNQLKIMIFRHDF